MRFQFRALFVAAFVASALAQSAYYESGNGNGQSPATRRANPFRSSFRSGLRSRFRSQTPDDAPLTNTDPGTDAAAAPLQQEQEPAAQSAYGNGYATQQSANQGKQCTLRAMF